MRDFDPAIFLSSKDARRTDRFVQFAIAASREAIQDSGLNMDSVNKNRFGVLIGSGIGGMLTIEKSSMKFNNQAVSFVGNATSCNIW